MKSGFGSYILEFLSENSICKDIKRIGLKHDYIPHGTREELLVECGLKGESLLKTIIEGS